MLNYEFGMRVAANNQKFSAQSLWPEQEGFTIMFVICPFREENGEGEPQDTPPYVQGTINVDEIKMLGIQDIDNAMTGLWGHLDIIESYHLSTILESYASEDRVSYREYMDEEQSTAAVLVKDADRIVSTLGEVDNRRFVWKVPSLGDFEDMATSPEQMQSFSALIATDCDEAGLSKELDYVAIIIPPKSLMNRAVEYGVSIPVMSVSLELDPKMISPEAIAKEIISEIASAVDDCADMLKAFEDEVVVAFRDVEQDIKSSGVVISSEERAAQMMLELV